MAIGSALSVGLIGLKAFIVQIQAFVSPGLPYFSIIGLPDTSLSEARERVKSACQASGFKWPETRVTVNLSPASMPKKGSSHDLAIAASVLSAAGAIAHDCLAGTIVLGEVNLDGTVLPINGLLPIMLHAREQGIATIIVPYANLDEARLVPDVKAIGVRHVGELIELMGGDADYRIPEATHAVNADVGATGMCPPPGDMSEVMGQQAAKWALEAAAAGGHHLMMTGPPGTGKTMLASRIPGIMSPLNETEQLEVASIRSLCGTLPDSATFHRSRHPTIPRRPPRWWVEAQDWPSPEPSPARIAASCSWTRLRNSRRVRCRRCANLWNPDMSRFPERKAPHTIRLASN